MTSKPPAHEVGQTLPLTQLHHLYAEANELRKQIPAAVLGERQRVLGILADLMTEAEEKELSGPFALHLAYERIAGKAPPGR